MNKNEDVRGKSVSTSTSMRRLGLGQLLTCAGLLCLVASADADQLQVTGANFSGNAVYDLGISPSSTTPIKPLIASTTTLINNTADEATHGGFDALVWVPNSICKSLDLIAADATKSQIVRYAGASTVAGCYTPTNGTPSVNPTAQILFKWTKVGSGPALPNGVSVDASGNLFVVSSVGSFDSKPSVWVLPFNTSANLYCSGAAGVYCAPVLVDNKFGGTYTVALAETLVAGTSATTSTHTVLWNAGDLLVLVGDSFDARLLVYSHAQLYTSGGLINLHALPLSGPSSTPIPWAKFLAELAAPFGMDLWPANTTLGTNAAVLFTTIDGRILRFDTVQNKFITDFADRLGPGLQKIRVGSYANIPYAFVAQLEAKNTGQILVFGAPPASGANNPLAAVSKNVMNPVGLALTNSASQSLPTAPHGTTPCAPPNAPCVIAPLGPELVSTITAYPGDNLSGTVVEQNCIVQVDPRVTISHGVWSCSSAPALPIGAGTSYCPSFPAAVIPGSVCGHSGPTGAGFAVIEGTATGIDPNLNNSFITTAGNIDAVLPGATNLECANFATTGQIPLMAWGTRSDLTTVEGTIAEDTNGSYGAALGGAAGFLTELTSTCDTSTSGSRELSIFAIGVGLSDPSQSYVYQLQDQKYGALVQTLNGAAISGGVYDQLYTYISNAASDVTAAQSSNFTNNINCALNQIATADSYLRNNLPAFSSNLVTTGAGGGNENPAGDIDGRLANWYTVLNTMLAGNAPYASWPLPPSSVPVCLSSTQPQITSFFIDGPSYGPDQGYINWTSINTATTFFNSSMDASCNLTDLYALASYDALNITLGNTQSGLPSGDGSPTFGTYAGDDITTAFPPSQNSPFGVDTYTLTCFGAAGTTPATQSMLVGVSAATGSNPQLTISSFTADTGEDGNDDGYLDWTNTNATDSTTCSITDAYGGAPYNQGPIAGIGPNQSEYFYNYFCGVALNGSDSYPSVPADVLTLTCSDPNNGTAMRTLTITNPDGYNAPACNTE
jgi:hypothetical protein